MTPSGWPTCWLTGWSRPVSFLTGPKTASLTLEEIARETERGNAGGTWWDGVDGVENGLMAEIRRLCIVFAPADGGGYTQLLLPDAVTKGLLSERELLQLESALVFFTVTWHLEREDRRLRMLTVSAGMSNGQITSSSITDFRASLTMSTTAAATGETQNAPATSQPGAKTPDQLFIPS